MSEEKEKNIWDELPDKQTLKAFGKGILDVPRVVGFDIPQSLYETAITSPYGFKMGDYDIKTDDPNHKEYKQAFDFFEKYKKEVNPFLTGDKATELLQSQGFTNTKFGPNGVYTQRSKAEQDRITNESVVSSFIEEQRSFYNKFYNLDEEELETKWVDQLARTIPTFATQVLASVYNPIAGMSYGSSLMYADTYQTAKQYDVSPQEAGRLASIVSLVSFATNYGPSTLYNSAVKNNPKLFRDVLFNKSFKKNLHKNIKKDAFEGGLREAMQESIDEVTSMTAEGTYRDISDDEWWERIKTSASIGFVLGGTASSTLTRINNEKNKPILKKITDAENLQLPYFMEVNKNGDVNFNVKKEDFKDIEMYERVKKLTDSQEFRDKVDPYIIAEKNRKIETDTGVEIPMNVMIFNELNTNNPNTDDVDIEFNKDIPISIMTDKQLQEKNYDTEDFKISEIKEGEEAYEEGKRKFKVKVLGSNIYSSTGGSVILSKGTNQDVYIEEIVEVLYKKLSQTNPELKSKIDNWIGGMEGILNDNGVGGPRGIELFSKWYTFNYLGYGNTETAIKDVISIPTEITQEFDKIMGEQKDGTNVAFLFKGGDPIITDPVEDTEVAETTEDVDTPEQSFRLTPQQEEFFKDSKVRDENGELLKVYHGTTEDFDSFEEGDLGYHFGTKEQANNRIGSINISGRNIGKNFSEGSNIIPAYLNLKNPLRLNDIGEFGDVKEIYNELKKYPEFKDAPNPMKDSAKTDSETGVISISISEQFTDPQIIKDYLIEKGYDGIVYANKVEGEGDSYIAFNPEQIKSQFNTEPTDDPRMSFALAPAVDDFSDIVKALSNVDLIDAIDVEKFINNKEIGKYLVQRTQQLQRENKIDLKTKTGEYNKEQIEIISDVIAREALNEIVNNPKNAGAWYSTNMENAIKLLGIIHPEILSDINARTTFVIGLAITSNGQAPSSNLKYALEVYDFYKKNNRFPETEKEFDSAGSVSPSMREGFVKYNNLVITFGLNDANQFLNTKWKVGEIKNITGYDVSKEKVDQVLPGSAIFGPKIGGAFYPNLQGAYEYVTMDRWFMRTMGRVTGELTNNIEDLKPQIDRFRNTLLKTKSQIIKLGFEKTGIKLDEKKYPLQFKFNRKKIIREYDIDENLLKTDDNYAIAKASEILRPYVKNGFKNKTELNLSVNNLVKKVVELIDSPRNGGQIISFREIMKLATDKVNKKIEENNIEFNKLYPADLQAIIWFPEKRLFGKLRKTKSILRETSYEDEAKEILKSRGIDDKRITDIINSNEDYATKGGSFNQKNEESFRLAPQEPKGLELNPETTNEYFVRKIQDELIRLKVIQKQIGSIPEEQDAYLKAELFIGKASDKLQNFRNKEIEPLFKKINDEGFSINDLGDYLYAKHAQERNDLIKERTNGEIEDGSGMSEQDITLEDGTVLEGYNTILNKYKNTNIGEYANQIYKISEKTLDVLYEGQLITKEDLDYYKSKKMFKNYVPLKGKPDEDTFLGIGKGFSVSGKDLKRAGGRQSRANNPLVQVLADYEQAIIRAEKNKVGIAFYNLVKNNPSDAWSAKGLKHIPRYDSDGELQYFDPTQLKQKEIEVKVDGKRKIITINDKLLLKAMKNLGSGRSLRFLTGFNTFFRAINTTLSPEFIITNFERDLQAGLFNLTADYKGLTKKTFKNIFKAQRGIWDNIQGKETEWSNIYKEYKENGGKIGWFDQMTIDEKIGKLDKMLKTYQSKNKLGISLRATGKFISDINEMVESGIRVSTYKSLIDSGVSPEKSAQYAKNLTVNFNKKGELGSIINSLWVFSNAGIQGTSRLLKMTQTKRGKKIAGSLIAVGFMQSLLNRIIDEEDWEKFSDYNKDNYYLVLMPNGKALSLKAPYGFNVFKVAGSLIEEMMFGDTTLSEASSRLLKSANDAFNPIGGSTPLQIFSPTIFEPYAQIYENKNFFGGPIMPEQPPFQPKTSDNKRYFKSVRKIPKSITKFLNDATGGTDNISGFIDVSPETIDHLIDSYTGSTGKVVSNLIETGTSLAVDGKLPSVNNIPIVRQFIKEESEYTAQKVYYYMMNESKRTKFNKEQRKRFIRNVNYMKKGEYNKDKYKTRSEWIKYLNKQKKEFRTNQRNLK